MSKITPTLWFNHDAEAAAHFYVSLLPDSHIETINRAPVDTPGNRKGDVMLAVISLAGQRFCLLKGEKRS